MPLNELFFPKNAAFSNIKLFLKHEQTIYFTLDQKILFQTLYNFRLKIEAYSLMMCKRHDQNSLGYSYYAMT